MVIFRTIIVLVIGLSCANAQQSYVVYFTDKTNTPYTLDEPADFLSQKAINRRAKQGIELTEEDLPVNPSYIDEIKSFGVQTFYTSKWLNNVLVQMDADLVQTIDALPFVANVELVSPATKLSRGSRKSKYEVTEGTDDVENTRQNNLLGTSAFHMEGFKGEGILIAFMDSGYEGVDVHEPFAHLFTNGQLKDRYNFVANDLDIFQYDDHGTRVISPALALVPDEFESIAPNANYLLYTTEDISFEQRIEEYNYLYAIERADSAGADIVNASLAYSFGFNSPSVDYTYEEMDGKTAIITIASEIAFTKGMLVVTSNGNDGNLSSWPWMSAPADGPNVLSVGSVNVSGQRSSFSSIGPTATGVIKPNLMAMGSSTVVVNKSGAITSGSGTSFTSPQIAALAALLWQKEPELTNKQLFDKLLSIGNRSEPDNFYGYGIPNIAQLVTSINEEENELILAPNPFENIIRVESKGVAAVSIIDLQGRVVYLNSAPQNNLKINTEELKPGLYLVDIVYGNKARKSVKMIKQ